MPTAFRRLVSRAALVAGAVVLTVVAPRAAAAQQGEVYGPDELSAAPRLVSAAATARMVARSYPEALRRNGTGGTVQLQFVIGTDGKVEPGSVSVLDTPAAELGSAAKAVVEKMEFVPGKKGSAAVRARVQLPLVYQP